MARPPLEVADLIRAAGRSFIDRNRSWLNRLHLKVLTAIERCRTSALGGHLDACTQCGHTAISFNSCRDRHCPRCQSNARDRWIDARSRELLPAPYVHVVFTLPHELAPLALQNKGSFMIYYFGSVPKRSYKSHVIRNTWVPTSASSACSIAGIRSSSIIHMFTASCRQAAYPRIARGGLHRIPNSSFPWMYWPRCSAPSSTKR